MILACNKCDSAFELGGDAREVEHLIGALPNPAFCFSPDCAGSFGKTNSYVPGAVPVPPRKFFRAAWGLDSICESESASFSLVRHVLKSEKIVSVVGRSIGDPERSIIDALVTESGKHIHFAASSQGACIYLIENPTSAVRKVLDENGNEGDCFLSSKDREETGRAIEDVQVSSSGDGCTNSNMPAVP